MRPVWQRGMTYPSLQFVAQLSTLDNQLGRCQYSAKVQQKLVDTGFWEKTYRCRPLGVCFYRVGAVPDTYGMPGYDADTAFLNSMDIYEYS